jgi:chromate transporter
MTDTAAPAGTATPVSLSVIAVTFLRISLLSFGGGMTAWAGRIVIEKKHWLTPEEFLSGLAICQILPGPNMVNFSVYLGNRLRGTLGILAALAGLLIVPLIIVLTLGYLYFQYQTVPGIQNLLSGMAAAAVGMAFALGIKLILPYRHRADALVFIASACISVGILRWPMVPVILVLAPISVLYFWEKNRYFPREA